MVPRSSIGPAQPRQAPSPVLVTPTAFDDLSAVELVEELYQEQLATYAAPDSPYDEPAQYLPPDGLFLVAVDSAGRPVGCGGYRAHLDGSTVEIRKMYTRPAARGSGVGGAILQALENGARAAGKRRLILETGAHNTAALALYAHFGFRPIPSYVPTREASVNRAFAKTL